jgi:hypothetical protein
MALFLMRIMLCSHLLGPLLLSIVLNFFKLVLKLQNVIKEEGINLLEYFFNFQATYSMNGSYLNFQTLWSLKRHLPSRSSIIAIAAVTVADHMLAHLMPSFFLEF